MQEDTPKEVISRLVTVINGILLTKPWISINVFENSSLELFKDASEVNTGIVKQTP